MTALRYAPEFKLAINDADLPPALRSAVTSVRYQDGTQAADRVEIGLANPDLRWLQSHIRGLGFRPFPTGIRVGSAGVSEGPAEGAFDIDNKVALSLGYADEPLEEMFVGELTGVNVTFPSGGMPTMTIVAHDYLNRLSRGAVARGFGFLPEFLVASILSAENLLLPAIDPAVAAASTAIAALNFIFKGTGIKQRGSDLELLQEICARYDADFWVDGDTLYVSRFIKEYSPRLTLTWGESLIDFSPRLSTVGQVAGVGMKFTLREIPLDFLVTVFWDFDRETLGVSIVPGAAASVAVSAIGSVLEIIDQPIGSPADITNSARCGLVSRLSRC